MSHFKLPHGRCRGTAGCRSYTVACPVAEGHLAQNAGFANPFLLVNMKIAGNSRCIYSRAHGTQMAENGELDPQWLDLAILGAPRFSVQRPPNTLLKALGPLDGKYGAPQKRQSQPRRILGPLPDLLFLGVLVFLGLF